MAVSSPLSSRRTVAALLTLTAVTGLVDAVSYLRLGRVFVANMTGNVVFVGFAAAGAPGFSLSASLAALAGFLVGAFASGAAMRNRRGAGPALLRDGIAAETLLVAGALVIAAAAGTPFTGAGRAGMAALLAIAMGVQNAVARRLAVPDLTTTVLTMTLTGIAADLRGPGRTELVPRRVLAVLAMLGGAIAGALLILDAGATAALAVATGVLATVGMAAALIARRRPAG